MAPSRCRPTAAGSTIWRGEFAGTGVNTSTCLLDTFKEGIPHVITRPVLGTGPGADYQRFTRDCSAFATEDAMVMLRVNRRHFGPINKLEAEYFQPCNDMLRQVEAAATCTP